MNDASTLFVRLQLRPDATEQDVRRAYARELKKIDQETEPEAFQALRETYERLTWRLRSQAASAAAANTEQAAEPVAPATEAPAEAAPQMPPNIAAGHAVLDRVVHRLNEEPFKDRADALDFLRACIEDERLASVDARQYFEWGIASVLASGWRPGHELLFAPAVQTFGWREDRSRLLWLGRPGEIVDDAITEEAAYDSQADVHRTIQRIVIRALRKPARPRTGELLQWLPVVEYVASAFPAWLHVVSNPRQVEAWRAWDAGIPKWRRKLTRRPKALRVAAASATRKKFTGDLNWGWGNWAWAIFLLMTVVRALTSGSSPPKPVTVPPSLAVPAAATAPPLYRTRPASPFDLAPDGTAPITADRNGLGLRPSGR